MQMQKHKAQVETGKSLLHWPPLSPSIQTEAPGACTFPFALAGEQGQLQPHPQREPSDQINEKPLMATVPLLLPSPLTIYCNSLWEGTRIPSAFIQGKVEAPWGAQPGGSWKDAASTHSPSPCSIAPGHAACPRPGTHPPALALPQTSSLPYLLELNHPAWPARSRNELKLPATQGHPSIPTTLHSTAFHS